MYALASIDDRGRVAAQAAIRSLGWAPGTRLAARLVNGFVCLAPAGDGSCRISRQGHLRISVGIRGWCGLAPGSRVLLAAEPTDDRLMVCPAAALDSMIAGVCAPSIGGDVA